MLRIIFFIGCFTTFILAESFQGEQNLDIISKNISMQNNVITATNDVIVYSPNYYITADKLIYDRNKSTMELFGEVTVVQDGQSTSFSKYLFIDNVKDLKSSKPLLMIDEKSKIWFNVKETESKGDIHFFENSTLSSCDCIDPAWNIGFTSGDYDAKEKWLNTYNTTLFIKGVPVLYTPYFGFSTDKTRRSGLLPPTVGYSSDEGILYAQPFYYAPTIDFDLAFIPQIRHNRGYGYETNLRYADSLYSNLEANFGAFYEKDSYYEKQKLTNKRHDGWNIKYDRTKLFSKDDHSDGLKIDLIDINDIDYQTTKYNDDIAIVSDKTIESLIRYYYNTNSYYGDIEFSKIKDLSQDDSDDILQTLPKINLHKYSNSLFLNSLTYSFDVDYHRQSRHDGLNANTTDLTIPVTYTNSLFDDYLEFSLGEELNLLQIDYQKNNPRYTDGKYASLTHFGKVQTNLIKPYENYLHTINLSAAYKKPEEIQEKGDLYSINSEDNELSAFPATRLNETIELALNSSLYDKDTLEQLVNYKISQLYTHNNLSDSFEKDELAQNIRLSFGKFKLNNDTTYSHELNKIVSSSTTLDFTYDQVYFNTYYKYNKNKTTLDNQEDLVYTIGFNFDNNYSIAYREEKDLSNDLTRKKEYIFGIDKKCWALNLKYVNSVVATDTLDNSTDRQHIVYLEFNLKQLFNLQQTYKRD